MRHESVYDVTVGEILESQNIDVNNLFKNMVDATSERDTKRLDELTDSLKKLVHNQRRLLNLAETANASPTIDPRAIENET